MTLISEHNHACRQDYDGRLVRRLDSKRKRMWTSDVLQRHNHHYTVLRDS